MGFFPTGIPKRSSRFINDQTPEKFDARAGKLRGRRRAAFIRDVSGL
jgi:hypothetical protein